MSDIRRMYEPSWYIDSIGTRENGEGGEAIIKSNRSREIVARIYGVEPEHAEAVAKKIIAHHTAACEQRVDVRSLIDELQRLLVVIAQLRDHAREQAARAREGNGPVIASSGRAYAYEDMAGRLAALLK